MFRRPPRSTRSDTLFPYPTLFRSLVEVWMTFKPITSGKGSIINLPQLTTNSLISLNDSRITTKGEHLKVWGCCAYTNIFLVMDDGIVTDRKSTRLNSSH